MADIDAYAASGTIRGQAQTPRVLSGDGRITIEQVHEHPEFPEHRRFYTVCPPTHVHVSFDRLTSRFQVPPKKPARSTGTNNLAGRDHLTKISRRPAGDPTLSTGPGPASPMHPGRLCLKGPRGTPTRN